MIIANLILDEKNVLLKLGHNRRYKNIEKIAELSFLNTSTTEEILNRFEKLQLVKSSPIRKLTHPVSLIKEFYMRGRTPSSVYITLRLKNILSLNTV